MKINELECQLKKLKQQLNSKSKYKYRNDDILSDARPHLSFLAAFVGDRVQHASVKPLQRGEHDLRELHCDRGR